MTSFPLQQSPKPSFKRIKPTAAQRGEISNKVRKELGYRSQGCCERCGRGRVPLEAAHTLRRWKIESRTTVNNLAHLCIPCHRWADGSKEGRQWLEEFQNKLHE